MFSYLFKLSSSQDARVAAVSKALLKASKNDFTDEEQMLVSKIESLRLKLLDSEEKVTFQDFGVGSDTGNDAEVVFRQRTVREICSRSSKSQKWARVLFTLVREVKPALCLEMGACLGISAAYQASAIKLNGHGKLITIEGAQALADLSLQNLEYLALDKYTEFINQPFADALPALVNKSGSFDYIFIDGHHEEQATLNYFKILEPVLSEGAIVIFDDIFYSAGMWRAWKEVKQYGCWKLIVTTEQLGICVYTKDKTTKHISINF